MAKQTLETALKTVSLAEARRLRRILDARLSEADGDDDASELPPMRKDEGRAELDERRRALAREITWTGGEGLEYQRRLRSEWDDRLGVQP